jgi:hypothetical protein
VKGDINGDNSVDNNGDNESDNDNNNTDAGSLTRPSYYECVFADLKAAHGDDHKNVKLCISKLK